MIFFFFFLNHCNSNVGSFNVVPEVSETILNSFYSFFFILLFSSYCHNSIFQLTYLFFCLSYSATDSFCRILNFINFVICHCLFVLYFFPVLIIYVKCFLNFIHSVLGFWKAFAVITLNSFSGSFCLFPLHLLGLLDFYPVPSFAQYFSVFSFYLTYCVWVLRSPGYRVIVPLIFGLCPWWVRLVLWCV